MDLILLTNMPRTAFDFNAFNHERGVGISIVTFSREPRRYGTFRILVFNARAFCRRYA